MNLILTSGYPFPYPSDLTEAQQGDIAHDAPGHRLVIADVVHFEQKHTTTVEFASDDAYLTAQAATGWRPWSQRVLEAPTSAADGYDYPAIIVGNIAFCGYQLVEQKAAVLPLVTPDDRKDIAAALREGVAADIWYDASDHGDDAIAEQIEQVQNAMAHAAELLDPTPR